MNRRYSCFSRLRFMSSLYALLPFLGLSLGFGNIISISKVSIKTNMASNLKNLWSNLESKINRKWIQIKPSANKLWSAIKSGDGNPTVRAG